MKNKLMTDKRMNEIGKVLDAYNVEYQGMGPQVTTYELELYDALKAAHREVAKLNGALRSFMSDGRLAVAPCYSCGDHIILSHCTECQDTDFINLLNDMMVLADDFSVLPKNRLAGYDIGPHYANRIRTVLENYDG